MTMSKYKQNFASKWTLSYPQKLSENLTHELYGNEDDNTNK